MYYVCQCVCMRVCARVYYVSMCVCVHECIMYVNVCVCECVRECIMCVCVCAIIRVVIQRCRDLKILSLLIIS